MTSNNQHKILTPQDILAQQVKKRPVTLQELENLTSTVNLLYHYINILITILNEKGITDNTDFEKYGLSLTKNELSLTQTNNQAKP